MFIEDGDLEYDMEPNDLTTAVLENFKNPAMRQSILTILRHALTTTFLLGKNRHIPYQDNNLSPSQQNILYIFEPLSSKDITDWILSIQNFPAPHIPKADSRAELLKHKRSLQSEGKLTVSDEELSEWIASHPVPEGYMPPAVIPLEKLLTFDRFVIFELHQHMPTLLEESSLAPISEPPLEETAHQEATRLTEQLSQMALINISSSELHSYLLPENYNFDKNDHVSLMMQETLRNAINTYQKGLLSVIKDLSPVTNTSDDGYDAALKQVYDDYNDVLGQLRQNKKNAFIEYLATHDTVRDYISQNMPQLALSNTNFQEFKECTKHIKIGSSFSPLKRSISLYNGKNWELENPEDTPESLQQKHHNNTAKRSLNLLNTLSEDSDRPLFFALLAIKPESVKEWADKMRNDALLSKTDHEIIIALPKTSAKWSNACKEDYQITMQAILTSAKKKQEILEEFLTKYTVISDWLDKNATLVASYAGSYINAQKHPLTEPLWEIAKQHQSFSDCLTDFIDQKHDVNAERYNDDAAIFISELQEELAKLGTGVTKQYSQIFNIYDYQPIEKHYISEFLHQQPSIAGILSKHISTLKTMVAAKALSPTSMEVLLSRQVHSYDNWEGQFTDENRKKHSNVVTSEGATYPHLLSNKQLLTPSTVIKTCAEKEGTITTSAAQQAYIANIANHNR